MALTPGSRLGAYDIVSLLGEGGMGQVYRATDTNLKRQVALKVLPASVAGDAERLARFQREAEVLASLNHPHIAQIFGVERSGGTTALVMELVEGDDLSARIARGAVPLDEALPIARQIADALEAAHEQGIVHRDLKPANVKVRRDGTVKVLDFGLAKAIDTAGPSGVAGRPGSGSIAATITSPAMMTGVGIILGTAAYMSPEQAAGKPVDKRSDLWAFGVVLLEMLTGRRVFEGETVSHVIAAVLTKEPDWTALPADTPPGIRTLLRRCLQKDRRKRLADAADAALEIDEAMTAPSPDLAMAPVARAVASGRLAWAAAAMAIIVAVALAVVHFGETPPAPPLATRTDIAAPPTSDPAAFALSPDGRQVVFAADDGGRSMLWLRALDQAKASVMPGTEGANFPFWSPDSRSVAFFAGRELKRLDVRAGATTTLARIGTAPRGGTWLADGSILFAPNMGTIHRLPATGGDAAPITSLAPSQRGHRFPMGLPGSRHFVFFCLGPPEVRGIYLGSLDGAEPTRLTSADLAGAWLPDATVSAAAVRPDGGWLLWVQADALRAQRLDVARRVLVGEAVTIAESVASDPSRYVGAFSASTSGQVAYRAGAAARRQLRSFDRAGNASAVNDADDANLLHPRLSPDGRRVVVSRTVQNNMDLWLIDGARTSRFTFDPARDFNPVWSPDGSRVLFSSQRGDSSNLYVKAVGGAAGEELLVASSLGKVPTDWSRDGRFVLFHGPSTDDDSNGLWALPLDDPRTPRLFLQTPFDERSARLSPDGRWVAYVSNESGRPELYARPFDGSSARASGGQWQISTAGGDSPAWSPDGREIHYLAPDARLMAAPVQVQGATFVPGTPVALFQTRIVGAGEFTEGDQYDVTRDGRFLINTVVDQATTAPITLIQHWRPPQAK